MNIKQPNRRAMVQGTFIGAGLLCGLLLILGATVMHGGAGRYQLATWSLASDHNSGRYGALVVDTATGETQIVLQGEFQDGRQSLSTNRLGKVFSDYNADQTETGKSIKELKEQAQPRTMQ